MDEVGSTLLEEEVEVIKSLVIITVFKVEVIMSLVIITVFEVSIMKVWV